MNILLTGAGGFVGGRLAGLLKEKEEDGSHIVLLTSRRIEGFNCVEHKGYTFDSKDLLINGIDHYDVVIHAGGYVPKSVGTEDTAQCFSSLANTQYLLTHLPNIPQKICFLSSVTVYKDFSSGEYKPDHIMISEDTVPDPESQYGLVKYSSELLIRDWAIRNGLNYDILRLSSIYGIGDTRGQMLMLMIDQAVEGKSLQLYANPKMVRNQLYVDDCCDFICRSADLIENSLGIVNLASSSNWIMEDIVKTIVEATGGVVSYNILPKPCIGKDMRMDASKREKYLGKERYTLIEGIRSIYKWKKRQ